MDPYATPDFLYELIKKCAQTEFAQATLSQIKTAHGTLGLKNSNKKKDDLISDIFRFLANILVRQNASGQLKDGFPLFNQKNEFFQRNASIQHLIDTCNQKIHIANVHLAQINHNKLNQVKKALNLNEGQSLCICSQAIDAAHPKENLIKCINPKCNKLMHKSCMKIKPEEDESQTFECPECVLFKCDPLHEVIKTLIIPHVVDNQSREFWIDEMIHKEIHSNDTLGIEVRVMHLESKTHEHSWPHHGELEINQFRVLEFKPLQQNSSLKKRKDEKLFTNSVVPGLNSVKLKYIKGSDPRNPQAEETYIASVYLVRKLSCEELIQRVKEGNRRSVEECKKIIVDEFESSMLDIDKVVCPLTCVFDLQPLKTPAKGTLCKHPSCFSLENYVNLWQKNPQRKWICPICKLKAYDLIVDAYMEKILEDTKKSGFDSLTGVDVEIMRNADYRFVKNELENENNEEQKIQTKIEKPAENFDVIVLDDSDEETRLNPPAAVQSNGTIQQEPMAEEPKETKEPEKAPAEDKIEQTTTSMEVEPEKEKEKQPSQEEAKEATDKPDNTIEAAAAAATTEEAGKESSKVMEEEKEPTTEQKEDKDKDKDIDKTIQIEDNDDHAAASVRTPDSNHIDLQAMTRPDDHLNEVQPIVSKSKGKAVETMEEEVVPAEKPKTEKSKKTKPVAQEEPQARNDQQALLQAALEQFQQLQASEEYRLQQQRQQYQQQQQQQQRLQWLAESLSLPNMAAQAQSLQNLQGVNLGTLFGAFGNNANVFQQAINSIPALLMNQLKAKLQQQVGRATPEDLAALLLGDSPYKANFGGDLNYSVNLLRQMNELAMLQALGMNGMGGGIPLLNGLNALNNLNPNALGLLLQQQQQQQQQQQNKANEVPVPPARPLISSPQANIASSQKQPASKGLIETEDNSSTLGNVISRQPEVLPPPVPYKRKNENAPRIFNVQREVPADRVTEEAKKSLEKLLDLSEKKLELPSFDNFKEMNYPELKKIKEPNLQKNKKLVALVMKQFPGQYRSAKPAKTTEEQEAAPEQTIGSANEPMETEEKVPVQEQQEQLQEQQQQQQQQQDLANVKSQGQESDPICLE